MPAVTEPPGLLMYSQMSAVGSSASRYSSCAQSWLAISSLTSVPSIDDAVLQQAGEDVGAGRRRRGSSAGERWCRDLHGRKLPVLHRLAGPPRCPTCTSPDASDDVPAERRRAAGQQRRATSSGFDDHDLAVSRRDGSPSSPAWTAGWTSSRCSASPTATRTSSATPAASSPTTSMRSLVVSQRCSAPARSSSIHHTDCGLQKIDDDDVPGRARGRVRACARGGRSSRSPTRTPTSARACIRVRNSPFIRHKDAHPRLRLPGRGRAPRRGHVDRPADDQ